MTLLLLRWYWCFWASLANWGRYFGRPDWGTAAVHLATAPMAVLVDLSIWLRLRRVEFPCDCAVVRPPVVGGAAVARGGLSVDVGVLAVAGGRPPVMVTRPGAGELERDPV